MLGSAKIKYIKSLQLKKNRQSEQLFIIETPKVIDSILKSNLKIREIYHCVDYMPFTEGKQIYQEIISEKELERISGLKCPHSCLALVEIPSYELEASQIYNSCFLVLDDIRDPGNLGSIIRIADWFGIEGIICSENTADAYQGKCVQSCMGSIANVPIYYTDLEELISKSPKDFPVYGTFLEGKNIYQSKLPQRGFYIIGNEAHGINKKLENMISEKIHIPQFSIHEDSKAESLNAAIATAIVCSEIKRFEKR